MLNNNHLLGKVFALTILILGVYILYSVVLGKQQPQTKDQPNQIYHIGCYDIERPLSASRDAQRYISQLGEQFNSTSSARISEVKGRLG